MNRFEDLFYWSPKTLILVSTYFIAIGIGVAITGYLSGDLRLPILDKLSGSFVSVVRDTDYPELMKDQIQELNERMDELVYAQVEPNVEGQDAILENLKKTVSEDLAEELELRYYDTAVSAKSMKRVRDIFDSSIKRLEKEIESLSRRSSLNLTIGILTTAVAVGLLGYMVLGVDASATDWPSIANHYIPRVSVALFIEAFSFFFLRLYKSNIVEIKHYQDKILGVAQRQTLLEAVVHSDDHEKLAPFFYTNDMETNNTTVKMKIQPEPESMDTLAEKITEMSTLIKKLRESIRPEA